VRAALDGVNDESARTPESVGMGLGQRRGGPQFHTALTGGGCKDGPLRCCLKDLDKPLTTAPGTSSLPLPPVGPPNGAGPVSADRPA
jgi:hypothetical protein